MQIYDPDNDPVTEREAFKLLKNPLPEPPRRNHVRMEFDLAMDFSQIGDGGQQQIRKVDGGDGFYHKEEEYTKQ